MTDVMLEFLASSQVKLLEEMRAMRNEMGQLRDDVRAMAAIVQRLDRAVLGLVNEVRAEHSRFDQRAHRVDAIEEKGAPA
jgi:hypothetical protein